MVFCFCSSFDIILLGKRELAALLLSWLIVVSCCCHCYLPLPNDAVGMQYMIVVFHGHNHYTL